MQYPLFFRGFLFPAVSIVLIHIYKHYDAFGSLVPTVKITSFIVAYIYHSFTVMVLY